MDLNTTNKYQRPNFSGLRLLLYRRRRRRRRSFVEGDTTTTTTTGREKNGQKAAIEDDDDVYGVYDASVRGDFVAHGENTSAIVTTSSKNFEENKKNFFET